MSAIMPRTLNRRNKEEKVRGFNLINIQGLDKRQESRQD
jgi:hypothetical protein